MVEFTNKDIKSALFLYARLVRRSFRRLRQGVHYYGRSLTQMPIMFANSFPKSGTHLLTQVMKGFTDLGPVVDSGLPAVVTFEGDTGRQRSEDEVLQDLRRLLPGDIAYGHVHATPQAISFLCRDGVVAYFILRDPRDVVVSHAHYVTEMEPKHIHYYYYREVLPNFEERLRVSIVGVKDGAMQVQGGKRIKLSFPDIRSRFEPYLGWLTHPEVLSLFFEDFINDVEVAVGRVYDHALRRGFPAMREREAAIRLLLQHIDPHHSPTFRSGKVGEWREVFSPEHKRIFKDVTGDLLIQLGYEKDQDW